MYAWTGRHTWSRIHRPEKFLRNAVDNNQKGYKTKILDARNYMNVIASAFILTFCIVIIASNIRNKYTGKNQNE